MHIYVNKNRLFSTAYFIFGSFFLLQQTTNFKDVIPSSLMYIIIALVTFIVILKEVGDVLTSENLNLSITGLILAIAFLFLSAKEMSNSSGSIFLLTCILIFSARDIELNNLLKPFLIFSSTIFVLTMISSKLGIIDNMISFQHRWRSSLGFSYVSFPAQLCFYFILAYIVYRNDRLSYKELFGLFILNLYIYAKTVTTSPFYLAMLMILISLSKKILNRNILSNKLIMLLISLTFLIAPLILVWICYMAPRSLFFKLNDLTNGRLELSVNGIQTFGIHLFGRKIHFTTLDIFGKFSSNYNFIDSSYIQLIVIYGIVYTILILVLLTIMMLAIRKMGNEFLLIGMMIISIHSMFDPQLLVLWYSPFTLLIGRSFIYPSIVR